MKKSLQAVSREMMEKWAKRLEFCRQNAQFLSVWEDEFIFSMEERFFFKGKDLTPKQVSKIYEIFHKVEGEVG